jgi:hypothetical protein
MAIYDQENLAGSRLDAVIAAGTGPALGVAEELQVGMMRLKTFDNFSRGVRGLSIDDDDLKARGVVILSNQLTQQSFNRAGFVANRDDDRNERAGGAHSVRFGC